MSGVALPEGLVDGSKLPEPVFTPTTKAPVGEHDLPMAPDEVEAELGGDVAAEVSRLTRAILARGNEIAASPRHPHRRHEGGVRRRPDGRAARPRRRGADPRLLAILAGRAVEPGHAQPSFDKQFVRDWLTSPESGW